MPRGMIKFEISILHVIIDKRNSLLLDVNRCTCFEKSSYY